MITNKKTNFLKCRNVSHFINNKKAQSPGVLIVVITVLVLVAGLIALGHLKGRLPVEVTEKNIDLISQYSKSENILFYLDESARITTNEVIESLYQNSLGVGCGEEDGLMLWKDSSNICVPLKREIEEFFLLKFLPEFNSKLAKFNLYNFNINEYTLGDLYIDQNNNELIGYPFKYQSINEDQEYRFSLSFSQELPESMFNNGAREIIDKINSKCSQYEDININDDYQFNECVWGVLEEINQENLDNNDKLIWQHGKLCGDDLFNFVQEYNDCARSYDNFCECQLSNNFTEYNLKGNQISNNNQTFNLELPFDTETEQILPLYKSDNMLHLDGADVPLCRLNDRTINLCLIDGKYKLHFQAYIDDNSKPKKVTLTQTKLENGQTNYTWQPSSSGDVKKYLIFIAKEDLPFPSTESTPSSKLGRAIRYSENMSYLVDSGFKAKIVPIDYSGNLGE